MASEKDAVRQLARDARIALGPEARAAAAAAVTERLLALPELADVRAVLGYAATPEELDPARALARVREAGVRIAYPRVCAPGELALHWAEAGELEPGYCGIAEPGCEAPKADLADIDAVLVPGAAFDARCHRIGMGGGFYDRLLPRLGESTLRIGIAFDEQVVERVPDEAHDAQLDIVVTPSAVYRSGRAR